MSTLGRDVARVTHGASPGWAATRQAPCRFSLVVEFAQI